MIRKPFDKPDVSKTSIHIEDDMDLTVQEFREECDINHIMAVAVSTGDLPQAPEPSFVDYDTFNMDYTQAFDLIDYARKNFDNLPLAVRERYGFDPRSFLRAINTEGEKGFLQDYGILARPVVTTPAPADSVVTPPAADSSN